MQNSADFLEHPVKHTLTYTQLIVLPKALSAVKVTRKTKARQEIHEFKQKSKYSRWPEDGALRV